MPKSPSYTAPSDHEFLILLQPPDNRAPGVFLPSVYQDDPATSMPLRVLIVSPQPFYEDRGTPIAVAQLAAALSDLGHAVDVIAYPIGRDVSIPRVRILRSANPFRMRSIRIGFSLRKVLLDMSMLSAVPALLATGEYDVVHVLEEMALPVIAMCRWRKQFVIYDMQSSLPDQLRTHLLFRNSLVQLLLRRAETWMLRRADAIVCSAGLLDHVLERAPNVTVREWKYVAQAAVVGTEPDRLRQSLGLDPTDKIIVYCGTFEPYQGLEVLLHAMPDVLQSVPDAVLVLIGATPEHNLAADPLAQQLIGRRKLCILGRQRREIIPAWLQAADVLVSPRAYGDNVPLKIFDYMMAGKPIVATDIRAHRSLLSDETAKLVGNDRQGLATGLVAVLQDSVLAAHLGESAVQHASAACGMSGFVDLVRQLYAGVGQRRMQEPWGAVLKGR